MSEGRPATSPRRRLLSSRRVIPRATRITILPHLLQRWHGAIAPATLPFLSPSCRLARAAGPKPPALWWHGKRAQSRCPSPSFLLHRSQSHRRFFLSTRLATTVPLSPPYAYSTTCSLLGAGALVSPCQPSWLPPPPFMVRSQRCPPALHLYRSTRRKTRPWRPAFAGAHGSAAQPPFPLWLLVAVRATGLRTRLLYRSPPASACGGAFAIPAISYSQKGWRRITVSAGAAARPPLPLCLLLAAEAARQYVAHLVPSLAAAAPRDLQPEHNLAAVAAHLYLWFDIMVSVPKIIWFRRSYPNTLSDGLLFLPQYLIHEHSVRFNGR